MRDLLTDETLAAARDEFAAACMFSRDHSASARLALNIYGDHGALISGCVREHFPDDIKNGLRFKARAVTRHLERAYALRPKRTRVATMVKLGRLVATRDGAGFYGPQPIRTSEESGK